MEKVLTRIGTSLSDEGVAIDILTESPAVIALGVVNLAGVQEARIAPALARTVAAALIGAAEHCERHGGAALSPRPTGPDVGLGRACELSDQLAAELCDGYSHAPVVDHSAAARWDGRTLTEHHQETDRRVVEAALAAHGGVSAAARALGISRQTFYRIMDRTGLRPYGAHKAGGAA